MGFCGQASLGNTESLRFVHHRTFRAHECQWPSTQLPLEFQCSGSTPEIATEQGWDVTWAAGLEKLLGGSRRSQR